MTEAPDLAAVVRQIRREFDRIREDHDSRERLLDLLQEQIERAEGLVLGGGPPPDRRPLRDLVLEVLGRVGVPLQSTQVADLVEQLTGRPVRAERLGTLAADERKAFDRQSRRRPVWLCHVLVPEASRGEFTAVRSTWARSDWPVERRVSVSSKSMRVLAFEQIVRFCELAQDEDLGAAEQAVWHRMAMSEGEFLRLVPTGSDLEPLHHAAAALLAKESPSDLRARRKASPGSATDPRMAMFGRSASTGR